MEKLSFLSEWYDNEASVIRKFVFSYYPSDSTVEMFDIKNHKLFLKRIQCDGLTKKDIFVRNTIKVFGRQIKILDYADSVTRKKLEKSMQRTFAMIKPDGIVNMGEIFCFLIKSGCQISRLKMTKLSKEEAKYFYSHHQEKSFFPYLIEHITSGPVIGIDILAEDSIVKVMDLVGPVDPSNAKSASPECIRAKYGQDITRNVMHVATSLEKADQESLLFFETRPGDLTSLKPLVKLDNSTCCIIKPHAVQQGLLGKIICMIEKNGFIVSGLQLVHLSEVNAEEFFEVYKGVVPEYMEIARHIRPNTIRAVYGNNKVENAVHVTDLPEDAPLELEYFFKILPS